MLSMVVSPPVLAEQESLESGSGGAEEQYRAQTLDKSVHQRMEHVMPLRYLNSLRWEGKNCNQYVKKEDKDGKGFIKCMDLIKAWKGIDSAQQQRPFLIKFSKSLTTVHLYLS